MRSGRDAGGLGALAEAFEAGSAAGLGDGELLDRFLGPSGPAREAAVAALVARHSALVWRACRAMTSNDADAADAFQATFLILLRRAGGIRRRESVAGWLGGVARRVGANARVASARRRAREREAAARSSVETHPAANVDRAELAEVVRAELTRLPDRDRAVILACDLDGLTETEAACRLGCPVGTVRSRLHRARARLRRRFAARGLDPTAALGLLPTLPSGPVPAGLLARTAALAGRCGGGAPGWASACPVAVATLIRRSGRSLPMLSIFATGTLLVALAGLTPGLMTATGPAAAPVPHQDPAPPPPAAPPQPSPTLPAPAPAAPAAVQVAEAKARDMGERFRKLKFAYDRARLEASNAGKAGKTRFEQYQIRDPLQPDETQYARDMIALALLDPKSTVARDAAAWVMDKTWMSEAGAYGAEYEAAVNILIGHHADDPEAVRVGLQLDKIINRHRDAFLEGCYANAEGHESRGLARLAYAQYLENKLGFVGGAHNYPKRNVINYETYNAEGKLVPVSEPEPNVNFAYDVSLRWIDPEAMRAEAVRLYREVIADYADVRYVDRQMRRIAEELANPVRPDGSTLGLVERSMAEDMLRSKTTLADVARTRLGRVTTLEVGREAPEVEGVDVATGRPFKLTDHRGRDVLLVFWGDIENKTFLQLLKDQAARPAGSGRPLAILGVISAQDRATAGQVIGREHLPWPNTFEESRPPRAMVATARIAGAYKVANLPRAVLIGADGKIIHPAISVVGLRAVLDGYAR